MHLLTWSFPHRAASEVTSNSAKHAVQQLPEPPVGDTTEEVGLAGGIVMVVIVVVAGQ